MTLRCIGLAHRLRCAAAGAAALLSCTGLACLNTSPPRGRVAVGDQVVPPAKLTEDAPSRKKPVAEAPAQPDAAETPEVEVVPVPEARLGRARATVLIRAPVERVR